MNDSPGWASPGSSPSDPGGDRDGNASDDASRKSPEQDPAQAPGQPPRKWSAEQPPPAAGQGWGATAPPPGAPQGPPGPPGHPGPHGHPGHHPGPHAPPGWGAWSGWNHPPVAKPGVIPLRPLGVGEILDGAVSTARAHWRTALGVAFGIAVLVQLVSTLASGIWLTDLDNLPTATSPQPTPGELLDLMFAGLAGSGIALLTSLIGTVIATAMLTVVVSRAVLGRDVTVGDAWREARPRIIPMLGLTLLIALLVVGSLTAGAVPGTLLLATDATVAGGGLLVLGILGGAVLGIWLWVRFCLSAPALMLEKQGVTAALRRSAKLVRKSWWRIFGIQLLALLLVQIVSFIVQLPASAIAMFVQYGELENFLSGTPSYSWTYLAILGVGAVLAMTVTLPLNAGITALLYMDQRIRREALDLELARAAGVDGAGSPPPPPAGS